jgi:hypothetical protein
VLRPVEYQSGHVFYLPVLLTLINIHLRQKHMRICKGFLYFSRINYLIQMKTLRYSFFGILAFFILFSFAPPDDVLQSILRKINAYSQTHQQEKIYVHFDKPFYAAGDNIWFKTYLVEASLHQLDSQSRVVYAELMNSDHVVMDRKVLPVSEGISFGDFKLSDSLAQGKYLIRAYTNYMKNTDEAFFFSKEISVLNQNVSQNAEPVFSPDSTDLTFYPEGGNLVACGSSNRVAFKALSPDGKSIAVEGEVLDQDKKVIAQFTTQHEGMGVFSFKPEDGRKYTARITKPFAVNRNYNLPKVLSKGYILQVTEAPKSFKVVVIATTDKPADGKLPISFVVQSRGKIYFAQPGVITTNATFAFVPKQKLPDGISHITIFDVEGRPVAERLIYLDQKETIDIELKTDKESYGKRELLTLTASPFYRNGQPAKGHFSISVFDEGILASEKFPLTITNYLALVSDLKGRIENPGYYFKDSLVQTKKDLDLLMMVHGWSRFSWSDVLSDSGPADQYHREQGIPISGRVLKTVGKGAAERSIVKIMTMTGEAKTVNADTAGRFYSDDMMFYDSMSFVFQTENEKGKKKPYKFILDHSAPPPISNYPFTSFVAFNADEYLRQNTQHQVITTMTSDAKMLKEVEVTASRIDVIKQRGALIGNPHDVMVVGKEAETYSDIFLYLQSRVAGLDVSGTPGNMTVKIRGNPPALLVNGAVVPIESISMINPSMIESVEVVKGPAAARYGAVGAINVNLKPGAWEREPVGVNNAKIYGYDSPREFYSPRYDVQDDRHNQTDNRTTLYWNPKVKVDEKGNATVSFYTADANSRYRIVFEGITPDGYPGSKSISFSTKGK